MRLGVLSVREKKARPWERAAGQLEYHTGRAGALEVLTATLPYTGPELAALRPGRRNRLCQKARAALTARGAAGVVPDRPCGAALGARVGDSDRVRLPIPRARLGDCLRFALNCAGDSLREGTAYLKDPGLETVDFSLLAWLSPRIRYLCLVTEARTRAEALADRLCEAYGLYPEIRGLEAPIPGRAALAADFAAGTVRLGRERILDGMEAVLPLPGYDLDPAAVLDCLPALAEGLVPTAWMSGNTRLEMGVDKTDVM